MAKNPKAAVVADWPAEDEAGVESTPAPVQNDAGKPETKDAPTSPEVAAPKVEKPEPVKAPKEAPLPTDLATAMKERDSLAHYARIARNAPDDVKAKHSRFIKLAHHVSNIQQGLPVLHLDANTDGAFAGLMKDERKKWDLQARWDINFRSLLAAHDKLAKEVEELKAKLAEKKA